jgi:hypothetical protein
MTTATQSIKSAPFPFHETCGVIHLHTLFSDGGIGFGELIDAAREVGLDYIVVTDHMTLRGRDEGYETFHGNLCVVVGYEHNDIRNRNHYLAVGVNQVFDELGEAEKYVAAIKRDGGIGFIAHPFEKRNYLDRYPPYPWTDWEVNGYDGIELWNQMSEWLENLTSQFKILHLFHPRSFLREIPRENLACWDRLNKDRFVSAVAGVDAHTMKSKLGPLSFTIFPVKVELKGLRTHLYLDKPLDPGDPSGSRKRLLDAMKCGHGFISNYRCGEARGARIYMTDAEGAVLPPGYVPSALTLPLRLEVELPGPGDIRFFRNGELITSCEGNAAGISVVERGLYRVEIFKRNRAWIYSNPFPVNMYSGQTV